MAFVILDQVELFFDSGLDQDRWVSGNEDVVFIQLPVVRRDFLMADGVYVSCPVNLQGGGSDRRRRGGSDKQR